MKNYISVFLVILLVAVVGWLIYVSSKQMYDIEIPDEEIEEEIDVPSEEDSFEELEGKG